MERRPDTEIAGTQVISGFFLHGCNLGDRRCLKTVIAQAVGAFYSG